MDGNKHFIRIDANNWVIDGFSDAFRTPEQGDILVAENAERHYNPVLTDGHGNFIYKWDGTNMVDRTQDIDYLLPIAKKQKLAELGTSYNQASSFFSSSALSTPHTYACGQDEKGRDYMTLFNAQFAYIMSVYYDGSPILWYTVEVGDTYHTKDQFAQVYQNGMAHVGGVRLKRNQFASQIENAITMDELNAITFVW